MDGFDAGRDVGAAAAVMVGGRSVVDIWHGHADRRRQRPWQQDTLVCLFSVTKAFAAVSVLQAVDRGLLSLDQPVADHWPEFAAQGKDSVTLRHLLAHQAGLPGFHEPVDRDLLYDWDATTRALAAERPWWPPGSHHGYHARTFGFLLGEVLARATGKRISQWLREELAPPLDLDFHIGLADADLERCAEMLPARIRPGEATTLPPAARALMRDLNDVSTPTGSAFQNPSLGPGYLNSSRFRQAELPSQNGHGTARSVARLYDGLASLLSPQLLKDATTTHSLGPDLVLKAVTHFGLGLMLHHPETPIGVRAGSFGHAGAGGAVGFHDPNARASFCFAMNQMEQGVISGGVSANAVAKALYECL